MSNSRLIPYRAGVGGNDVDADVDEGGGEAVHVHDHIHDHDDIHDDVRLLQGPGPSLPALFPGREPGWFSGIPRAGGVW